jgi:hypothetical protein
MKFTCPCCGYKTLTQKPPGTFQICKVCFWEDDRTQFYSPDFKGGSNEISLREAQQNFIKFGASRKRFLNCVQKLTKNDVKDSAWRPLDIKNLQNASEIQ